VSTTLRAESTSGYSVVMAGSTSASLTGASLTGASLTGASLTGAGLTGAGLTGGHSTVEAVTLSVDGWSLKVEDCPILRLNPSSSLSSARVRPTLAAHGRKQSI
jgi:uncharacterized protein YjbI with pentapeptide repeats